MNHTLVTIVFSLLCPWLALVRLLQFAAGGAIRRTGVVRLTILGVAALGVLAVPVGSFTIGGWIRGIEANFSIPFAAMLAASVWRHEFGRPLLGSLETQTACAFALVAGLILYPLALGLGNIDPYEWGWGSVPLFAAVAALTAFLLWKQNRFGIVLLIAALACNLRVLESSNYWDYLLDPVYFVFALAVFARRLIARASVRAGEPKAG